MVMGVFAEIRNGFECFCKCNIFCFPDSGKEKLRVFSYLGMFQYSSPNKSWQCCEQGGCWTYLYHCQIADKNPSKRWNVEFWGFRICIGFGLLPHIVVFRVCLYNGTLCCGFLCARLISASFPATTPRLPRPYRYIEANRLPHLQGYHTRATTLHTNLWVKEGSCLLYTSPSPRD